MILPRLDRWLAQLFTPAHIEQTVESLTAAQDVMPGDPAAADAARRRMAENERKLSQFRAALEADANPATVAGWMREELDNRAAAERQLQRTPTSPANVDRDQILAALRAIGDMIEVLGRADPLRKAKIYRGLGLQLRFHPEAGKVHVSTTAKQSRIGDRFVSEGGLELRDCPCVHAGPPLFP